MSKLSTLSRSASASAVSLLATISWLLRVYLLPFAVSIGAATVWLAAIAAVTEATANTLLVLVMVALPGVVVMALSRSERRRHWYEYALVWLMFFTSVPLYGVALLIGGYGIVLARAWRRRWPHALQDDED